MRVTGGCLAGRGLKMPKGARIRPSQDRVRAALFNLLGEKIIGARVLDLFSGSGALGIEAFSRGAGHVTFVEQSGFCVEAIRRNLEALDLSRDPSKYSLRRGDAVTAVRQMARRGAQFDLVLLDPPYDGELARISLIAIGRYAIVSRTGWVVVEHGKREILPAEISEQGNRLVSQRVERYGDTALTLYQRQ